MQGIRNRRSLIVRGVALAMALALPLAGCAENALQLAPPSASEPWVPGDTSGPAILPGVKAQAQSGTGSNFGVPADPAAARLSPPPQLVPGRTYELPGLIDLAARNNPQTRIAWEEARQAALAVGMSEATFLPSISANVIAGVQRVSTPLPDNGVGPSSFSTTAEGIVPAVVLEWLVFDFGQRRANTDLARHNAFAANIAFNGMHQQVIYNVTVAYYRYGATRAQERAARKALANAHAIQDATDARKARGLTTSVAVAQARQQVAQAKLRLVEAEGARTDAYQALLAAMGVSPTTRIEVADSAGRRLPPRLGAPTEKMITQALSKRPDVLAAYSRFKASEAAIRAAEAAFRPKVFLSAIAARDTGSFAVNGLPGLGIENTSAGVLVGVTIPIYTGGLLAAQREQARSVSNAAKDNFVQIQEAAAREIVIASNTLRTALAAYEAASELTRAAAITYDAAFEAYKSGVGTLTDATAADTGLLDARVAQADAHAAALVAAATVAFALGTMTSAEGAHAARPAGR